MTHFVGIVVTNNEEELSDVLSKYDEKIEAEPYFVRYKGSDITRMANHYKIDRRNKKKLLTKMNDLDGCDGAIKMNKFGRMSTYNKLSKWDWYVIGGIWKGIISENISIVGNVLRQFNEYCTLNGYDQYSPSTLVSSDGWFSSKDWGWLGCYTYLKDKEQEFNNQLEKHKDKKCYIVDFHI